MAVLSVGEDLQLSLDNISGKLLSNKTIYTSLLTMIYIWTLPPVEPSADKSKHSLWTVSWL